MNIRRTLCRFLLGASAVTLVSFGAVQAQTYDRILLIEEFTSATCGPCVEATPVVNRLLRDNSPRAVSVRYHLNIPTPGDPWYLSNRTGNDSRAEYYNVRAIPNARVDGSRTVDPKNQSAMTAAASARLPEKSPIKLDVTQTRGENNVVTVTIKASAGPEGLRGGFYKLKVAVVESEVHVESLDIPGYNGEKEFFDIFRTFATGHPDTIQLAPNQSKRTITATYTIGEGWQQEKMFVVAWVQDEFEKEVIQTGFSAMLPAGIDEPELPDGYALGQSVPNPAIAGDVTVPYTIAAPGAVAITLHDATGRTLATFDQGILDAGDHTARLDLSAMPAGVYTYTVRSGRFNATRQLVLVR